MLRRLPKNCVDGEGNNKENHHNIRTNIEREYFLPILIMFGTVAMQFEQTVALFFIILFVCVGAGSYCMLEEDSKWDIKIGGMGSRKIDLEKSRINIIKGSTSTVLKE